MKNKIILKGIYLESDYKNQSSVELEKIDINSIYVVKNTDEYGRECTPYYLSTNNRKYRMFPKVLSGEKILNHFFSLETATDTFESLKNQYLFHFVEYNNLKVEPQLYVNYHNIFKVILDKKEMHGYKKYKRSFNKKDFLSAISTILSNEISNIERYKISDTEDFHIDVSKIKKDYIDKLNKAVEVVDKDGTRYSLYDAHKQNVDGIIVVKSLESALDRLEDLVDERYNLSVYHGRAGTGKSTKVSKEVVAKDYKNILIITLANVVGNMFKDKINSYIQHDKTKKVEFNSITKAKVRMRYTPKKMKEYDCIIIDEFSQWGFNELSLLIDLLEMNTKTPFYFLGDTEQIPSFMSSGNLLETFLHKPKINKTHCTIDYRNMNNETGSDLMKKILNEDVRDLTIHRIFDIDLTKYDMIITGSNYNVSQLNFLMFNVKHGVDKLFFLDNKNINFSLQGNNPNTQQLSNVDLLKTLVLMPEGEKVRITSKRNLSLDGIGNIYRNETFLCYNADDVLYIESEQSNFKYSKHTALLKQYYSLKNTGYNYSFLHKNGYSEIVNDSKFFASFQLAYAITVNKAQGLEWSDCLVYITRNDLNLLNKNALYTAVSRGRNSTLVCSTNYKANELEYQHRDPTIRNYDLQNAINDRYYFYNNFVD